MNDAAFSALLHEHAGLLSRIAASYEANAALRDDLLQDTALALWKALPKWRGDAALKTFVARGCAQPRRYPRGRAKPAAA